MPETFMSPLEHMHKKTGRRLSEVFDSFLLLAACGLMNPVKTDWQRREDLYMAEVKRWDADLIRACIPKAVALLINEMHSKPYTDILGSVHETLGSKKAKELTGEFYTPQPICQMMAQMTAVPPDPNKYRITFHEPCSGSGRMILALAEVYAKRYNILPTRLYCEAWDISKSAVYMTIINTSLWGIPCLTVHGNTLSMEHWSTWPNLFAYEFPLPRRKKPAPKQNPQPMPEPSTTPLGIETEQTSLFAKPKARTFTVGEEVTLLGAKAQVRDVREGNTLVLALLASDNPGFPDLIARMKGRYESQEAFDSELYLQKQTVIENFKFDVTSDKLWLLTKPV